MALAQTSPLPAPSPVEKELAARASDVTEVTLGKNMLAFAAKIMNGKNEDDAEARRLIEGLEGSTSASTSSTRGAVLERKKSSNWQLLRAQRLVADCEGARTQIGESTDVMVKLVNGEPHGMFILDVEPQGLTIVLILGPIHMDDLGKLKGIGGLSALGDVARDVKDKDKDKTKDIDKDKTKDKKGDNQ